MVQVPQLKRIESTPSAPRTDRINIQAQNNASSIQSRTQGLASLGGDILEVQRDVEDNKINTTSQEAEKEFNTWNISKLQALKSNQGDPTDAYAQYDIEVAEKYDSMIKSRPNLNDRVKRGFTANLNRVVDNNNFQSLKQRGAQQETYDNNLYESAVGSKRDGISINAGHIKLGDNSSYEMFDRSINELKSTIAQRSLTKGGAERVTDPNSLASHTYIDADGQQVRVKMNDMSKRRAAQEISKGVSDSISNMINSGYTAEAQQTFEKYKLSIDIDLRSKLTKKFKNAKVESKAFEIAGKIDSMPEDKRKAEVAKIKNFEEKVKVEKILEASTLRRSRARTRKSNQNEELLMKDISTRESAGQPYAGVSELESSQLYKNTWDSLNTKSRKAVTEAITAPKKSEEKSLVNMNKLILGEVEGVNIEDLTFEEFNRDYLPGLSGSDRKLYTSQFRKLKDPGAGAQRSTFNLAGRMLEERMLIDGHIKKTDGFLSSKDDIKLLEQKQKLIAWLGDDVSNLNNKEIQTKINEFSADEVKKNASKGFFSSLFNSDSGDDAVSAPERKKSVIELKKEFKDKNGYFPTSSDPKFKTFLKGTK